MRREDARRLVVEHHGADDVEKTNRRELLALIDQFEDPWNRDRYVPGHLTASAFVLHPDRSAIALVHHAKLDLWVQPGGHVESGDHTHEAAARREVEEECVLSDLTSLGTIDIDVHVFPERGGLPSHLHFDLRWGFVAGSADVAAGDGTLAVRWVPLARAETMDESIARAARKLAVIG